MKLKRFRNKFISMLLTLAMLLTLFPTAVFAEDTAADRPASAEFKIMGLYALRDNGRRVSFFSYESRDNAFLTKANMTYPDSWFKLIYVIERSQPVTLELYEMKDEPAYMDEDIVSMPYAPEDDADGHGKLQSEEFLGRRLGVLVGVPVQENIVPLQEGDDIYTAEQVGYSPIDEDEWLNIVYQTIRGKRQPKVIEDFYAFGFEGNRLVELDDAAATVSLDELPAPEHMAETDALIPSENLDAPNPEANLSADINDEAMDTEKSPANETSEDGASEESLTTDTESATAIDESFAPSANIPFSSQNETYTLLRVSRKTWVAGKVLYLLGISAVYYLVLFIAGALFISENAFVANIWSLPLTVLVQNQAPELAWEYQVSFPYGHLLTLTPAIACVLSYLLSVCYVFVMSLIIFWLNLRISKVLSYLAAVLVHVAGYILTIGFLTDSYRKFSLLANSLLMYHNINGSEVETAYLALPQSFLVYAAVAVMLFLLILHAIHSYDFRITVGTKQ
jgi:hypothetical protein